MTNAAIAFPRATPAVRDLIRRLLDNRPESWAQGVTVSTKLPPTSSDEDPGIPRIAVRSDGRFRDSRLNGRASIRVLVWHRDEGLGEELAVLLEGLLLASSVPGVIRGFGPLIGPQSTTDPDTGNPLTYFTVTARLVPSNLSGDTA